MHRLWAGLAVMLAGAGMSGCGGALHRAPMPPLGPTLELVNESGLVYRVTVSPGTVVQLYPGDNKCVRVGRNSRQRSIGFFPMAGYRTYYTPPENFMSESGWIVEIGELPQYDVLSLRPAYPCAA